jgi:diguanylate cyclase (GGDEF)-like protein
VLFLTGLEETDTVVTKCYDAGAHDLILKPIRKVSLLARLRVILREQAMRESFRLLAIKDQQTGLDNRGRFFMQLRDAILSSRRDKTSSFLILGGVDNLAVANERFGYALGDEVILTFARLMKRFDSPDSHAGRVAGDTLAIVMKNSEKRRALDVCERIRQTFAAIAFDAETDPKHFTASFGIAGFDGNDAGYDPDTMMSEADIALFMAKDRSRCGACAFWTLEPDSIPAITPEKRHARRKARRETHRAFIMGTAAE